MNRGIATIELLIAFALIVLVLTGVVFTVSGNQSLSLDTQLDNLALYKTEAQLEEAFNQSQISFAAIAPASVSDGIFSINTNVSVGPNDCYKLVTTKSSWWESTSRPQDVGLVTWFANPDAVAVHAGDCPTHPGRDPFDDPDAFKQTDIGGAPSTALDVFGEYVYMTANAASDAKADIYVYKIDDLVNDVSDDPIGKKNTGPGLNRIDVGQFGSARFAYAVSGDRSDIPEVQVINVTDPTDPSLVNSLPIPFMKAPVCNALDPYCSPSGERIRQSITVADGYLYVGIHRSADDDDTDPNPGGQEFFIYSLSDPAIPSLVGKLELNHNVNDIVVSGDYAFLATSDDTGEVLVVDVSDHVSPHLAGAGFNADGIEDGKTLALSGTNLYLGRRNAGSDGDLYVIDATDPTSLSPLSPPYDMDLNSADTEVRGITVRGVVDEDNNLFLTAFLAVNDPNESLFVLDVTDPAHIEPVSSCTDGYNTEQKPTGIDIDDDGTYVFMSNESNKNLKIIQDDNACS